MERKRKGSLFVSNLPSVKETLIGDTLNRNERKSNLIKCRFLRRGENRSTKGENLSEQSREPTNSGHIGGRRVLSSLRHHCSLATSSLSTVFKR